MSGKKSVNDDGCADEGQRDESEANFRTGKILGADGADLRADGCTGVHDQCDQDIHIAFYCVAKGSVTGRDDDLEQVGIRM